MLRFAMYHPTRVHGIVAINTEGIASASIQEKLVRWREVLFYLLFFKIQERGRGKLAQDPNSK